MPGVRFFGIGIKIRSQSELTRERVKIRRDVRAERHQRRIAFAVRPVLLVAQIAEHRIVRFVFFQYEDDVLDSAAAISANARAVPWN